MKKFIDAFLSFLKNFFLSIKIHFHVGTNSKDLQDNDKNDDYIEE